MSHNATIDWTRTSDDFTVKTYNRDHTWTFGGGQTLRGSAAPDYMGDAALANPEEAFVASLSSCHMLTFLALCAKRGFVVNRYTDEATGELGKLENGRMAMTAVTLRPRIEFDGDAPDAGALRDLHDKAHHHCFIANSVTTPVTVEDAATV
ncbi:MAG: OsmC family protein [Phycisphaerales bacterium]